jgi:hypothetical protein
MKFPEFIERFSGKLIYSRHSPSISGTKTQKTEGEKVATTRIQDLSTLHGVSNPPQLSSAQLLITLGRIHKRNSPPQKFQETTETPTGRHLTGVSDSHVCRSFSALTLSRLMSLSVAISVA